MPGSKALEEMIREADRKTAILDTNLLVVLITAQLSLDYLSTFKRVRSFTREDALLLLWLVSRFKAVATTSYVLTESSNLANELSGDLRDAWYRKLADFALVTDEAHVPTKTLGSRDETVRFGIADSALAHLSSKYTLITAEYRLSGYLEETSGEVINFNHLRPLWMLK